MRITKPQMDNLAIIHRYGGAVLTSQWTNGSGRYITRKAVPPFCERVERYNAENFPKRIQRLFKIHPKCKAVIPITNMRAANRALAGTLQFRFSMESE